MIDMAKHSHPDNRTTPTKDTTGRQWPPPAQPKMPNSSPPQGKIRKLKLATRDPRRKGG
jgi:hypothetical protein